MTSELVAFKVVGVTYGDRQLILRNMQAAGDSYFYLMKEPHNPRDPLAIRVCNKFHETVGYLAKANAHQLQPLMKHNTSTLSKALIIGGGHGKNFGLRVWLRFKR